MLYKWVKRLPTISTMYNRLLFPIALLSLLYSLCFALPFPITLLKQPTAFRISQIATPTTLVLFLATVGASSMIALYITTIKTPISLKKALFFVALASMPFLATYPADAMDYFANLWYSERFIVLDENPYETTYLTTQHAKHETQLVQTPNSPLLPYGPLWLTTHSLLYLAVQSSSLITITMFFKALHFITYLAISYMLLQYAQKKKPSHIPAMVALLTTPFPLFALVSSLHNDLYFVLLVLAGILAYLDGKKSSGALLLITSFFFKFTSLFLFPIILIYAFRTRTSTKEWIVRNLIWTLIWLILYVFLESYFHFSKAVFAQGQLVGFSLTAAVSLLPVPEAIPAWVGSGSIGLFVAYYIYSILKARNISRAHFTRSITTILTSITGGVLILVLQFWAYWYFTWLLSVAHTFSKRMIRGFIIIGNIHLMHFVAGWYLYIRMVEGAISQDTLYSILPIMGIYVSLLSYVCLLIIITPVFKIPYEL